jgi:N-acetylneuraminic acid mutarotase
MKRFDISRAAPWLWLGAVGCASASVPGSGAVVAASEPLALDANAAEGSGSGPSTAPLAAHPVDILPVGLTTIGATAIGNLVYVLGGYAGKPHAYSSKDQSKEFYRLDTMTHRWDKLASVGKIQSVALVNDGRYVYRIGGMVAKNDEGQPEDMHSVADVGRFDPESNTWQALTPLPIARSSHHAVLYGKQLYVIGGWTLHGGTYDSEYVESLASCDLSEPQCTWKVEPMPFPVRAHGAAVYQDKLYVLGGLNPEGPTDDVHVYDLKAGGWSKAPSLPEGNMTIGAAVHAGQLFSNGGDGNLYRLAADGASWQVAGALTFPRMFHALIEGPRGLLAIGGIPSDRGGERVRHIEEASLEPGPAGVVWTLEARSAAKNRQGALLVGQQLYVFGGNNSLEQHDFEHDNFVATAQRLDLGTLEWKAMPDFPARRQSMQALLAGSEEKPLGLVVGGFGFAGDHLGSQPEVYGYDVSNGKWTAPLSHLPVARSQFGLVSWEKAAWVLGGLNFESGREKGELQLTAPVLRLDLEHPEAGFADAGFAIAETRRAFAGGLLGDRYFMTGGLKDDFEMVSTCEVLDLRARTSQPMACPSTHRLGGQLVPIGDKLYLVGGSAVPDGGGDRVPSTRIEAYDPSTGRWATLSEQLPFDEPKQLQAFAYHNHLLLYTANRSTPTVQVALIDPRALGKGKAQYASIAVPKGS